LTLSWRGEKTVKAKALDETAELLSSIPYFAYLDEAALQAVAQAVLKRQYSKDEIIFLEGDPCAGLFIVEKGRVKVFKVSLDGREQVLKLLAPGEFFNEVAVLDGGPNPVSAMTALDSTLWIIDRSTMLDLLARYPALAQGIIENLAAHARHLVSLVEDLSLRTVSARLAKLLLTQAVRGGEAPQRMTQQEMAAQLGTVREMVGRVLRSFEDEGLIRFDRHRIVILDRAALENKAMM
jgi:CRP/FNR family cyclic AMP-dependent transcriptional regulator